jgi:hypothetical protein
METPSGICAVCGTQNPARSIGKLPEPAEPPDFDTRPGEPLRSTMDRWLQVCERCGYAAEDISKASSQAAAVVDTEEFQQLRIEEPVPSAARPFILYAHLLEKLHQSADAGWSYLHAAWNCDDASDEEAAALCRIRAIEMWKRGKAAGESFGDDMASEFALITDVYRRTGQFEQATVACAEGLDIEDMSPALEAVLRRQMVLIQSHDTAAHSIKELLRSDADSSEDVDQGRNGREG